MTLYFVLSPIKQCFENHQTHCMIPNTLFKNMDDFNNMTSRTKKPFAQETSSSSERLMTTILQTLSTVFLTNFYLRLHPALSCGMLNVTFTFSPLAPCVTKTKTYLSTCTHETPTSIKHTLCLCNTPIHIIFQQKCMNRNIKGWYEMYWQWS